MSARKVRSGLVPPEILRLRELPADQRAEAIIGMFSVAVAEFAALVLEHSRPSRATKDRLEKMKGGIAGRRH